MDTIQPHTYTSDYTQSSSLSEADSLSDSDWLDISSSKDSDDNDSVSSRASDRDELDFGPPSRRSSISIGSSRDGEIEAWEGFADESEDESVAQDDLIGIDVAALPPALRTSATTPRKVEIMTSDRFNLDRDTIEEEQRVKAALDQSMIGTLSASRTSSGHASTVQNSMRDLRLSFPDPLTSSRDELSISFREQSSPEITSESDIPEVDFIATTRVSDPSALATLEVLHIVVRKDRGHTAADLEIVLYGNPDVKRWQVVDKILEKAALGAGLTLTPAPNTSEGCIQLQIKGTSDSVAVFPKLVNVIDRTSATFSRYSYDHLQGPTASLAIIFLPSMASVSSTHTSYLPVFSPSTRSSKLPSTLSMDDAQNWTQRSIQPTSLFKIHEGPGSIIDVDDLIINLEPSRVYDSIGYLMRTARDAQHRRVETPKEVHISKDRDSFLFRMGVTGSLLAILAVLVARVYVLNMAQLPTPAIQAPPSNTARSRIYPFANKSSSPSDPHTAAVVPSTIKDYALAVFNPSPFASSSSSVPPAQRPRSTGSAPPRAKAKKSECSDGKLMSWSERVKSSKDLVLPGPSSLSLQAVSRKSLSLLTPKAEVMPVKEEPTALSVRLVDSLSQIFDVQALSEVVRHDMKELSDAIDQLVIVIGKQTSAIMEDSKGPSQVLRKRLEQRNDKAKARAKELRQFGNQLGSQLLSYMGSEIQSRADLARSKARRIADSVVHSDAWVAHKKRVEAHRQRMEANGKEREKSRDARRTRRPARKGRKEAKRSALFSRV